MKCPMTMNGNSFGYSCEKDNCAWWCSWANCCAITNIAAEISKLSAFGHTNESNRELWIY